MIRGRIGFGLGALGAAVALALPVFDFTPPPRQVPERLPEPVNSHGAPLKRGNHRQKADKSRDPYKRHRRV